MTTMFVQIIEGKVSDAVGLARQQDRWNDELRPGAAGFLGVTFGITADGRGVTLARFDSVDAARANSQRTEQGSWWAETEKCYDGPVDFAESTDVTEWLGGGSNDAGFVQVMKSTGVDRAAIEALDDEMSAFAAQRPDIIGGYRAWTSESSCVEAAYFTSEAEARAGEQAEMPPELAELFARMQAASGDVEYLDLTEPRLA